MKYLLLIVLFPLLLINCIGNAEDKDDRLPILGEKEIIDGQEIVHTIPEFSFINQDSVEVSNATFEDQIYVADFFFTSCPTICPKMTKQMKRIHDEFLDNPTVGLISHTIDVKRDTVGRLKKYSQNLGVETAEKWHFVTGDKEEIYEIADDYFSIAIEDGDAAEGFDHSGRLILVDKEGRVRSFADGTDAKAVDIFMIDMKKLLEEYQPVLE